METTRELTVIGGGLAGCEAAWQAAEHGIKVNLHEMRPLKSTGAHATPKLAELICSNSLGSNLFNRASGLLKEELRQSGSLLIQCADKTALPAGSALAVDREQFSGLVTDKITNHPNIQVIHEEVLDILPGVIIIASGPLTSAPFASAIQALCGQENLAFYDALAPVITSDSIDMTIAYRASRYHSDDPEIGDYLNCPFDVEADYLAFISELLAAERIPMREFETEIQSGVRAGIGDYFEGCLPIEILARRGPQSLAFGPLRPIGLWNPRTEKRPHAVVQLRQDNLAGSLYNLVGFQTNLTFPEQKRIFQMIPGLKNAEFVRYGQMHRNTYIASPLLLQPTLQFKEFEDIFFAGQITGVEGYVGNIATGLLAGINAARLIKNQKPITFPETTMLGALCYYITHADIATFQPMKANYGLLPLLEVINKSKNDRFQAYSERSIQDLSSILAKIRNV